MEAAVTEEWEAIPQEWINELVLKQEHWVHVLMERRVRTTHPLPTTHPLITQPAGWVLFSKPDPTQSRAGLGILVKPAPTRWVF